MASRWEWFRTACEIATMLQGEPADQRSSVMARLLIDVQDEMEAGVGNRQKMREAMERSFAAPDHAEAHSVRVPPLRLVEDDGSSATIDIDRYCSGCDSDQHTVDEPPSGFSSSGPPLWCNLCWDWQKPLSQQVKEYRPVPSGTARGDG